MFRAIPGRKQAFRGESRRGGVAVARAAAPRAERAAPGTSRRSSSRRSIAPTSIPRAVAGRSAYQRRTRKCRRRVFLQRRATARSALPAFMGYFTLFYLGQHYAGAYIAVPSPGDDVSFTTSTLSNLSDHTYASRLDVSAKLNTFLSVNGWQVNYGENGELHYSVDIDPCPVSWRWRAAPFRHDRLGGRGGDGGLKFGCAARNPLPAAGSGPEPAQLQSRSSRAAVTLPGRVVAVVPGNCHHALLQPTCGLKPYPHASMICAQPQPCVSSRVYARFEPLASGVEVAVAVSPARCRLRTSLRRCRGDVEAVKPRRRPRRSRHRRGGVTVVGGGRRRWCRRRHRSHTRVVAVANRLSLSLVRRSDRGRGRRKRRRRRRRRGIVASHTSLSHDRRRRCRRPRRRRGIDRRMCRRGRRLRKRRRRRRGRSHRNAVSVRPRTRRRRGDVLVGTPSPSLSLPST